MPINQAALNTTLLKVTRRAESAAANVIAQTFVDIGPLMAILSSTDHQIVYGRRGTGKTHALRYSAEAAKRESNLPIYIDLRYIGSSGGIYNDPNVPLSQRATKLLSDVLSSLHEELLTMGIASNLDLSKIGPALDQLATAIVDVRVSGDVTRETAVAATEKTAESSSQSLTLGKDPAIGITSAQSNETNLNLQTRLQESGKLIPRVHFGSVSKALRDLVNAISPSRLIVILDEWSTLASDIQPFLADLLRRAIFPISGITVKIAAIEQRSNFRIGSANDYTGIEVGADASADVDLDDFMVFDNNSERAVAFFEQLIYKHYSAEATDGPQFDSPESLIAAAFTQSNAFEDFVKAAEGVPRDAFNILMIAAQRNVNDRISIPTIRVAAKTWYQRDKESAIKSDDRAQKLLHWIIYEVIAHRRARAFLLPSNSRHTLIDALFDARLLHIVKKSLSAHDQPGVRYDAFKLDYGCYVDLLATSKSPDLLFAAESDEAARSIQVPPDDYRAIRRAILDLKAFEASLQMPEADKSSSE